MEYTYHFVYANATLNSSAKKKIIGIRLHLCSDRQPLLQALPCSLASMYPNAGQVPWANHPSDGCNMAASFYLRCISIRKSRLPKSGSGSGQPDVSNRVSRPMIQTVRLLA
jgi:hypothetical protein